MESDDKFFSLQVSKKESSDEVAPLGKLHSLHYFLILLCLAIAGCVWTMVIYAFVT